MNAYGCIYESINFLLLNQIQGEDSWHVLIIVLREPSAKTYSVLILLLLLQHLHNCRNNTYEYLIRTWYCTWNLGGSFKLKILVNRHWRNYDHLIKEAAMTDTTPDTYYLLNHQRKSTLCNQTIISEQLYNPGFATADLDYVSLQIPYWECVDILYLLTHTHHWTYHYINLCCSRTFVGHSKHKQTLSAAITTKYWYAVLWKSNNI